MIRRVLSIGDPIPYLRYIERMGIEITYMQTPTRLSSIADLTLPAKTLILPSLEDVERVVDLAAALHRVTPFDAVVSFTELGLLPAARVAHRLGLPANDASAVTLMRDKSLMREALVGTPLAVRHRRCRTADEARLFSEEVGYPFILKPVNGWASFAIRLVHNPDELDEYFRSVDGEWTRGGFLAEEFITGPEVSVEGFSVEGEHSFITITDKVTTGAPLFIETGHSMPSSLPLDVQKRVLATTDAFLTHMGHRTGPSHTEIRVGPHGPVVIESHTRPGGDFIAYMMELAFGLEMIELTMRLLLGDSIILEPLARKAAAVRYLLLSEGEIESIHGLDEVRNTPGIAWVDFRLQPGERVIQAKDSFTRHGCVVAVGETPDEAIRLAEEAVAKIVVQQRKG